MTINEEYVKFLDSSPHYLDEIVSLAIQGGRSFVVEWPELYEFSAELASALLEEPDKHLRVFREALYDKYRLHTIEQISEGDIHIRIRGHPTPLLHREISSEHVSKFISFSGITLSASQVLPFIVTAAYTCDCGTITLRPQVGQFLRDPKECSECQNRKLRLDPAKSHYIDIQYLGVQEMPENLPPGRLPVSIVVELKDDLCGSAAPGDRIQITGIFQARQQKATSRILESYVEANHVEIVGRGLEVLQVTPEEEEEIKKLAEDPYIYRRVIQSITPIIYGLDFVKEAVALELFGGVTKTRGGNRLRGDINVLLVGDPGLGKSQILQYASKASPRGIYTMGRGSTAAGLTAAVIKNPKGGFTLEAGAMVLVDKGLCCIDELEKMRDEDRGAIHPAMEQQVVSIAKGGIIAELNARCAVLAAANPTLGRYNTYQNIAENISNLPVTLLSRFDLIFVLRDLPETAKDEKISSHVLNLHRETSTTTAIPLELMRKYVSYSKKFTPHLTEEAADCLKDFYLKMRQGSIEGGEQSAISITVRQLESLVRLSEARARLHLREEVTVEDAMAAIALTQRSLEQVGIDVTTGQVDIDILYSGKPRSLQMQLHKVLEVIGQINRVSGAVQDEDLFTALLEDHGIGRSETSRLIGILMRDGTIYSPRPGYYKRT